MVAAEKVGPWLLVRTTAPVASGALWEHRWPGIGPAGRRQRRRPRRSRVQVSQGLSWERTAQDVAWELTNNPDVRGLAQCAHVVVQFGAAGAVMVPRQPPAGPADGLPLVSLVFDPAVMEGEWERDRPGGVAGAAAVLTAFVAAGLLGEPGHDQLAEAAARGLRAVRDLRDGGYEAGADGGLAFPFARVVAAGTAGGGVFDRVAVRDPARLLGDPAAAPGQGRRGFWTILAEAYPGPLDGWPARW